MKLFALVSILAVAISAQLPAQVPADPAKRAKPVLVCRQQVQSTGTHIRSGKRCKTAEQWAMEDARRTNRPTDMQITTGQDAGHERSQ